jgi:hypothetical protein
MTLATLGITAGHVAAAAWFALSWAFLIAVVGGVLLARWYAHDHAAAEETEAVMRTLATTTVADHSKDIL